MQRNELKSTALNSYYDSSGHNANRMQAQLI